MANRHSVADDGDLRKYYAAIPNIILTLGLNPFELALYVHFKQAAGDKGGVCWKSRATIAKEAGMSSGMVTKARQSLEMKRRELGGRSLIRVKEEASKTGGKPTCQVTITDVWGANMAKYSPSLHDVAEHSTSPDDIAPSRHDVEAAPPSPHDEQRHHTTLATSPHDHKEELLKKNPEEVKERQRGSRLPDDFCLNSEMREWAASNTPHVELDTAMDEFTDYWVGIPGARGRKLDWPATWRNRMRELEGRAKKNGNGKNQQRFESSPERNARNLRENGEYIRGLQNSGSESDREDPIGLLTAGI